MTHMGDQWYGPVLMVNPASDRTFREFAEQVVERLDGAVPADLQRQLRARYPKAVARARDLHGEAVAVWYVYREGHWILPASSG